MGGILCRWSKERRFLNGIVAASGEVGLVGCSIERGRMRVECVVVLAGIIEASNPFTVVGVDNNSDITWAVIFEATLVQLSGDFEVI